MGPICISVLSTVFVASSALAQSPYLEFKPPADLNGLTAVHVYGQSYAFDADVPDEDEDQYPMPWTQLGTNYIVAIIATLTQECESEAGTAYGFSKQTASAAFTLGTPVSAPASAVVHESNSEAEAPPDNDFDITDRYAFGRSTPDGISTGDPIPPSPAAIQNTATFEVKDAGPNPMEFANVKTTVTGRIEATLAPGVTGRTSATCVAPGIKSWQSSIMTGGTTFLSSVDILVDQLQQDGSYREVHYQSGPTTAYDINITADKRVAVGGEVSLSSVANSSADASADELLTPVSGNARANLAWTVRAH